MATVSLNYFANYTFDFSASGSFNTASNVLPICYLARSDCIIGSSISPVSYGIKIGALLNGFGVAETFVVVGFVGRDGVEGSLV